MCSSVNSPLNIAVMLHKTYKYKGMKQVDGNKREREEENEGGLMGVGGSLSAREENAANRMQAIFLYYSTATMDC